MRPKLKPGTVANAMLFELRSGTPRWLSDLKESTGYSAKQVSNAAALLRCRGLLHLEGPGYYRLTIDGVSAVSTGVVIRPGPTGRSNTRRMPRKTLRQRAWWAMRMRPQFTISEIVCAAENGEGRPADNLGRWFRWLKACGYIREMTHRKRGSRQGSNGHKRYRLIKDTGPRAPIYSLARRTLRDPNTGEEIPCKIKP